jgi:hypothetical protein
LVPSTRDALDRLADLLRPDVTVSCSDREIRADVTVAPRQGEQPGHDERGHDAEQRRLCQDRAGGRGEANGLREHEPASTQAERSRM